MSQTCTQCARLNPAEAAYCYFDGVILPGHSRNGGPVAIGSQRFPGDFVFPSGRVCRSYDELALACHQNWSEALQLLQEGHLELFLGGLGRADLALVARQSARFPDRDQGLDQLLARLPSRVLEPPRLRVEPLQLSLGSLRLGENRRFEIRLRNDGMRLLYGSMSIPDCKWLALGDAAGVAKKLIQFASDQVVTVQVQGQFLRAGLKPLEGSIVIETNGGKATVSILAAVPVKPFGEGVLAGALSPRHVAEKARLKPREAAVLLENGAVARWYAENGWSYPILGASASGLGAVQQFFEALGLTPPPRVEISEKSVTLRGNVGSELLHSIEVRTPENRPIFALAASDQPWLEVGRGRIAGRAAIVPMVVPYVPNRPGETLHAQVTVTTNGNQQFLVPVQLLIAGGVPLPVLDPIVIPEVAEAVPVPDSGTRLPAALPVPPTQAPVPTPVAAQGHRPFWLRMLPAALLLVLLGVAIRDLFVKGDGSLGIGGSDRAPRIGLRVHDGPKGDEADGLFPEPTMRTGLVMAREPDPQRPGKLKRLTFDEWGRSNNTCLRIDGNERLFGSTPGRWIDRLASEWKDDQGRKHEGLRSIWGWDDRKILVTQFAELVPGEQTGVLDTCLIRYVIENHDRGEHTVGLRFMLDTYIGANDGVPFTIPGESGLCDTFKDFRTTEEVPAFIQALENEDLRNPGTVAHVKLKLDGREPPSRVILGAWPDAELQWRKNIPQARGPFTLWEVPVLSMKTLWRYDSAVVIYWKEQALPAGGRREVGFAYGLGAVSSSAKLLLTVDGTFKPGGLFTVTALVSDPAPGETLTLALPPGFSIDGSAVQLVPEAPRGSASRNRPVTWKVKAGPVGDYELKVQSNTGASQVQPVRIRASSIFD